MPPARTLDLAYKWNKLKYISTVKINAKLGTFTARVSKKMLMEAFQPLSGFTKELQEHRKVRIRKTYE